MIGRSIALAVLAVAAAAAGVLLLAGGDPYRLTLRFENASQLVTGNQVKVGGVPVGEVTEIELADDNAALVHVEITDEDLTPLHEGTRAEVRVSSLSSVANRFIQLHPGPNNAPELEDGASLATASTSSVVEIDSVLATLDAGTRTAAQDLLRNQRALYTGATAEANRGLIALNPALSQLDLLARDLGRDDAALRGFLVKTASVVSAVAGRDRDLESALDGAAATARELSGERAALTGVLRRAPRTLATATGALRDLDTTFTSLRPAARELRAAAPPAARLVDALQPLLGRSGPALDAVRGLLPDLRTVLARMPGLRDTALPAFAAGATALRDTDPILAGTRPYVPDIFHGLVNGFGGTQADSYDANGQYARIGPVASNLSVTGAGSQLTDSLGLPFESGNTLRCPGGGARRAAGSPNNTPADGVPCRPEDAP